MLELSLEEKTVKVDAGELVSYIVAGHEYIHQKGSPGWGNSDIEMFPIIGPTAAAGFQVQTPRDAAILDQHGLLRELDYELIDQSNTGAIYKKSYKARTPVRNSKYPEKSNKQYVYWTYDFEFEKKFSLTEKELEISFIVKAEKDSPFMLGYHPAFRLETENPVVKVDEHVVSLDQVIAAGNRAFYVENSNELFLKDKNTLRIRTSGFDNFMLWTEVPNMICIEPITYYPSLEKQNMLHEGFQYLRENEKVFTVSIIVEN